MIATLLFPCVTFDAHSKSRIEGGPRPWQFFNFRMWTPFLSFWTTFWLFICFHLWNTATPVPCRVRCLTRVCVSVRYRHDTHTAFYILDITGVHVCSCRVRCPFRCFIGFHRMIFLKLHIVWTLFSISAIPLN